jgi:hypothetical protein
MTGRVNRTRVAVAFVGLALLDAGVAAQPKPTFAGRWVLESAKPVRAGYEQFWLGTEATIEQTAEALEIVRANPLPERRASLRFGEESQNVYTVAGRTIQRDSRATLGAGFLLISTDTTTEDGRRWLSNIMRWALESDGTLTVTDTEICGSGECPSIITTLRFKRQ